MADEPEVDRARLAALLGDPSLAWLVERCRRRLARGQALTGTATLADASPDQREAIARLLGRRPARGASLSVPLDDVERVLVEAGIAPDLATAVRALTGPIEDGAATARAHQARWSALWEEAEAWAVARDGAADGGEARTRWVAELRAEGLLRRLAGSHDPDRAADLLAAATAVVDALPASAESRPVLAARVLGDGHALDDDQPVATLVLRAIAWCFPDAAARGRRERWAAAGVTVDPLTSRVTVLGLAADDASVTGRTLSLHASAGEPATLTLRQLLRDPPDLASHAGTPVHVCENPSVMAAAADRLAAASAPLVCTHGQPSVAVGRLLDHLAAAGAVLRVHADLDWAGVRIAAAVMARTGAAPWRLRAVDYEGALAGSRKPLVGAAAETPWDSRLAAAMRAHGMAVEEELVLEDLLADLADPTA